MTRSRDVADTQDNSGGAVAPVVAGKNAVINGAFDIWQRGTSIANPASSYNYAADRWQMGRQGIAGLTVSRQATGDTTNLPNIQYSARVQRDSGNTSTNVIQLIQNFETVNSIPYAGKTVILSFYARAGTNFSAGSNSMSFGLATGTGTDQSLLFSYTGAAYPIATSATLTTTWQRFSATATLSASTNEIAIYFGYNPVGTAGANDYFEVTGVQLEVGSVATPFSRNGGTLQSELAACQRYYYRITPTVSLGRLGFGNVTSTTAAEIGFAFPVTMRTAPTALEQSGTAGDYSVRTGATNTTCSAVPAFNTAEPSQAFVNFTVASGLTAANAAIFRNVNTSAYLGWSAEL